MKTCVTLALRLDAFCARLNDGLAMVAVVLALVTAGLSVQRFHDVAQSLDPAELRAANARVLMAVEEGEASAADFGTTKPTR
jgi:hypothetical protein